MNNGTDSIVKNVDLLIIIVNWNTKELIRRCLQSLKKSQKSLKFEVVIIDNGSLDGSVEMLKAEFSEFYLILEDENLGFAKANNIAFQLFPNKSYYLLLNSDAIVSIDVIQVMLGVLKKDKKLAAVGPALKLPSGNYQYGGAGYGPNWRASFNTFFMLTKLSSFFKGLFIIQKKYSGIQKPVLT